MPQNGDSNGSHAAGQKGHFFDSENGDFQVFLILGSERGGRIRKKKKGKFGDVFRVF